MRRTRVPTSSVSAAAYLQVVVQLWQRAAAAAAAAAATATADVSHDVDHVLGVTSDVAGVLDCVPDVIQKIAYTHVLPPL